MKLNVVPARTGLLWVRLGVRTFIRQPLALGGLFFMFMGAVALLSAVPLAGPALALALVPAATLGLMAASREAHDGRFPMPLTLFTGFRSGPHRTRDMLVLGGAYAGVMVLLMLLAALLMGAPPGGGSESEVTPEAMRQWIADSPVWWLLPVYVPVLAAFWHAPALTHWHGVAPVKALFFSLLACWANKGAMLLFVAGWMGVMTLAGMLMSGIALMLGSVAAVQAVLYPVALLLAAMFHTSIWFSFRDSFIGEAPALAPTGENP